MKRSPKTQNYSTLFTDLASLIKQGRKAAVRYVNTALVATYWLIGRRIVEYEQKGKERAEYGKALLKRLSVDLTNHFGKGFGYINLNLMRQFYLTYPPQKILQTVSEEFDTTVKSQTATGKLPSSGGEGIIQKVQTLSGISEKLSRKFPLSWSHYCLLLRLDETFKREFYEAECIRGNWSVRQVDRQIQSMLYERTALSKRKLAVIEKAHEKPITLKAEIEHERQRLLEMKIIGEGKKDN